MILPGWRYKRMYGLQQKLKIKQTHSLEKEAFPMKKGLSRESPKILYESVHKSVLGSSARPRGQSHLTATIVE